MQAVTEAFFERMKQQTGVSLNDEQKQAVLHTDGPLLLLATPGSGKTTTLMMRIGYLIEEKGVPPRRIKAVTFSRASAAEMKDRFERLFPHLPSVDFSTIHSLAYEVVRHYFRIAGKSFEMVEGDGERDESPSGTPKLHKRMMLRELFRTINGDNVTDDQLDELLTYISYLKNKMIPEERWSTHKTDVPQAERVMREYESIKRADPDRPLLDYDDLLTIAEQAFEGRPALLRQYQSRYDYVLTDESQDTSLVQHRIVEKLVRTHGNLCVVADDDQSIYSWRGAEPAYLLNFKDVYPGANTLFMSRNYRSSADIVNVANEFIKRNKHRYEKKMTTDNPPNEPVAIKSFSEYPKQTKYIVQEVRKAGNLAEVAVLYRNNSSSIALMNALDRAGIPFYMKDSDNRFFSHWVVEDVLNFMRMTFTDRRPELFERIHTKVSGYVTKQQMAQLLMINNGESVFDNLLANVTLQGYQVKQIELARDTFIEMRGMPPLEAIKVIRERLGYEKSIEKMCERLGFRKEYLIGILNTLEEIAEPLKTMEDFAARLKELEKALRQAKAKRGQQAVTLSTMHSAKGLEFERVYMIDLAEGVIPSSEEIKAGVGSEGGMGGSLEEATRLFYVGMTRAKRHLELIAYQQRDGSKVTESRFVSAVRDIMNPAKDNRYSKVRAVPKGGGQQAAVEEIAPNAIRRRSGLVAGLTVSHRVFGIGVIANADREQLRIRFADGERSLSVATCLERGLLSPAEAGD
ncbi:ATP-dependent helicase [Cohnella panacarvi]|uniref:ATP-dependent helicase n=1 Tax=Cohnella panacarvi TaxID=400776 RepID=UPI00047BBC36|nr:ATP-dependent helicase [Cohnella panacarvi]